MLAALGPLDVAADTGEPLDGIAIGTPIRALAQTLGPPLSVTSDDAGNRFVFPGGTAAYVDDDGALLALERRTGSARISIDGTPHAFTIGTYSAARADAELSDVAEFSTATLRSYRLAPRRDLVLDFDPELQRLTRIVYGEPGQLARLGLLPGDAAAKAVAYRAPRPRAAATASVTSVPAVNGAASVYRLTIDRSGAVSAVAIAIDTESRGTQDTSSIEQLRAVRYLPAQLDGRPIAATIFVELAP